MADRTLGQVAYEKYAVVFEHAGRKLPWEMLRPLVRARWETVAVAVLEACGG